VRTCGRCAKVSPRSQRFCSACGFDLISDKDPDSLDVGTVIDKRYRLLAKLGEGGMGAVFRVEHVRMGKVMALKAMTPELVRDRKTAERFRREAQLVSKLDHPNIITVFDSGETESGLLYLVMEYIQGRDLSAILRDEGQFQPRRALELVIPVLRALEEAHRAGIIHRDIKPANVMLAQTAADTTVVKLLDFGVATVLEGHRAGVEEGTGKITGAFDVVGTPSCMSPEQARGAVLDPRSDVYSVSAMLFEMIAGRGVFSGFPLEVIGMHLTAAPPTLRSVIPSVDINDELESLVAKGLAKLPEERFQSAAEMRRAIELILGRPASKVAAPEKVLEIARREDWESFERGFRRQRLWVRLAAAAVLVGSFAGATYLQRSYERPLPSRSAVGEEQEPNDLPATANLIALDRPVTGHIGFRRVPTVSDLDLFELDLPTPGYLSITVNGVPNVNLVLEVLRSSGPRTATWVGVDDAPLSTGEEMSDLPAPSGHYFIRLSDGHRLDEQIGVPRENGTDAYVLQAKLEEARKFGEKEPNNRRDEAMTVAVDAPVLGRAGAPGLRTMIREGEAPLPTWSVDNYRLSTPPKDHDRVCAVLAGLRFASLKLTALPSKGDARTVRHAPSVIVRDGAQALCVKNDGDQVFEVRVEDGSTGLDTYPLAFFGTGPGGLVGVLALADELQATGRTAEAAALLAETISSAPRGPETAAAEAKLAAFAGQPR